MRADAPEADATLEPELDVLGRDASLPTLPLSDFGEPMINFAYVPVLVCKEPKSTVGIGDSISATGLAAALPRSEFRGKYQELADFLNDSEKNKVLSGTIKKEDAIVHTAETAETLEKSAYPTPADADGP